MLGLVDHKDSVQIKQITKLILLSPFSIRFSFNFFNIYLISIESFLFKLEKLIKADKKSGNYAMFDNILGINDFIKLIENKYNINKKFKIVFPVFLIKFFLLILNLIPFRISIVDKLLTFIYKDVNWINNLE